MRRHCLAIAIGLMCAGSVGADTPTVYIRADRAARPGDTVTARILVDTAGHALRVMGVRVEVDASVVEVLDARVDPQWDFLAEAALFDDHVEFAGAILEGPPADGALVPLGQFRLRLADDALDAMSLTVMRPDLRVRQADYVNFVDDDGSVLDAVLTFAEAPLEIVEQLPGDFDDDGDVDLGDYLTFLDCFTGPGGALADGCDPADFDHDGTVDLADLVAFQAAFTGAR